MTISFGETCSGFHVLLASCPLSKCDGRNGLACKPSARRIESNFCTTPPAKQIASCKGLAAEAAFMQRSEIKRQPKLYEGTHTTLLDQSSRLGSCASPDRSTACVHSPYAPPSGTAMAPLSIIRCPLKGGIHRISSIASTSKISLSAMRPAERHGEVDLLFFI